MGPFGAAAMNINTCIFSFNRGRFLKALAESLDKNFPWGQRTVYDDQSDDPATLAVLDELRTRPNWAVVVSTASKKNRLFGNFYKNIGQSIQDSADAGYDYCFLIEDDSEVVWHKKDMPEYLERVFSTCPDAIQINPMLFRRTSGYARSRTTGARGMEYIEEAKAYRFERAWNTTAIMNLEIVRNMSDYRFFEGDGDGLPYNSGFWLDRGYRLYLMYDPIVGCLPWVTTKSGDRLIGKTLNGLSDNDETSHQLDWLSDAEIEFLTTRDPGIPPYQEYFNLSIENTRRPFWGRYGQQMDRYYFLCKRTIEIEGKEETPLRIPSLKHWAPTEIAPLASHLRMYDKVRSGDLGAVLPPQQADGHMSEPPVDEPSLLAKFYRAALPQNVRQLRYDLRARLAILRRFSLADYFGYLQLSRRLRAEQDRLPYKVRR